MLKGWCKTLDLSDIWNNGDVAVADIPALGKEIAKRLRCLYSDKFITEDYELVDVIERLEDIITVEQVLSDDYYSMEWITEEFDCAMENLYDWADYHNRLCIITI